MNSTLRFHHRVPALVAAALGLALLPLLAAGVRADEVTAGAFIGSDAWFSSMFKASANQPMLQAVAKTNLVLKLPADCVEVAGTITFPEGNPFAEVNFPELQIICRDFANDSFIRVPRLDTSANFYTVLKRGQTYDFYWKQKGSKREKFCSLALKPDAQARQKMSLPYHAFKPVDLGDLTKTAPRDPVAIAKEYDLTAFPSKPTSQELQKTSDLIHYGRSTSARAAAHEMLAQYYRSKGDSMRARSESKKAQALKADIPEDFTAPTN